MSYGSHTFWDIYSYTLHPISGTVVVVIAFAIFLVGMRDHPERKPLWVGTIFGVMLLGFCVAEWSRELSWLGFIERNQGGAGIDTLQDWETLTTRARMMFMAQAGLAIAFGLGLLWWPIRRKDDS